MKMSRLVIGFAFGALLGLMFAPKTGDEFRADLKDMWGELQSDEVDPVDAFRGFVDKVACGGPDNGEARIVEDSPAGEV